MPKGKVHYAATTLLAKLEQKGGLPKQAGHDDKNLVLSFARGVLSKGLLPVVTVLDKTAIGAAADISYAEALNEKLKARPRPPDIKMAGTPTEEETVEAFGLSCAQAVAFRMVVRTLEMEKAQVGSSYRG